MKPSSPAVPLKRKLIAQNCGREGKKVFVITPRRNLELSMNALLSHLKTQGFEVKVKADLGTTFDTGLGGTASILKSGIMIVDGINSEREAYDFYNKIIVNGLRVPLSEIE